jgi:hypothetical protein
MGVQQVLLHLSDETKSILEYLCQQSGKLYNSGVYFARQTFFKTNKLLTGKFDLAFEPSIAKSMLAQSLPSTPMQQTLMSVTEAFKSFAWVKRFFLLSVYSASGVVPCGQPLCVYVKNGYIYFP